MKNGIANYETFISEEYFKEIKAKYKMPKIGDLLITAVGTIGNVFLVKDNFDFYFKDGNIIWLVNKNTENYFYLEYFLNSDYFQSVLKFSVGGSTYNALPIQKLKKLDFILPPKKEQDNIVAILSKQETIINANKILVDKHKNNISALQKSLLSGSNRIKLSDEVITKLINADVISNNNEKINNKDFSILDIKEGKYEEFVKLVDLTKDVIFYSNDNDNWITKDVNEINIQIPKDWNVEQMYKKVNFIKGKSVPENQLNYNGEGVKYLKTTEFWVDSASKRDTVHYSGKVDEKYLKHKGEYVFSMDGFNNKIGQGTLGLVSNEDEGIVSTSFYKLEKNDIYHLVVNVLKSNYVQNFIMRVGEGTTVYHAGKYIKNIQGIFPKSTVEQKLLSMIFEKEEKLIDSIKEKIKYEEQIFKYLEQELLSGRIKVKNKEE
jgi:restriction endonuclease S subunit